MVIDKTVSLYTYDRFFGGKWIRCIMVRHCFFHEHSHIVFFCITNKEREKKLSNSMPCFVLFSLLPFHVTNAVIRKRERKETMAFYSFVWICKKYSNCFYPLIIHVFVAYNVWDTNTKSQSFVCWWSAKTCSLTANGGCCLRRKLKMILSIELNLRALLLVHASPNDLIHSFRTHLHVCKQVKSVRKTWTTSLVWSRQQWKYSQQTLSCELITWMI